MDKQYKTFTVNTKAIDAERGIYEAFISTEAVDRDGDILRAEGADLTSFLKNPVVLFGHNYRDASAVVGKALEVEKVPGEGVKSRFQFAGADVSYDAELVRRLWAGGFLNATSVGFIPKKWQKRTDENGDELQRGMDFTEWELLEFSIVPVPANQEALRLAVKALQPDAVRYFEYNESEEADVEPQPSEDDAEPNNTDPTPHDESDGLSEDIVAALEYFVETITEVLTNE